MTDYLFRKFLTYIIDLKEIKTTKDVAQMVKNSKGKKPDFTPLIPTDVPERNRYTDGIFRKIVKYNMGKFNTSYATTVFNLVITAYRKLYKNVGTIDGNLPTDVRKPLLARKDLTKKEAEELYERSKKEVAITYEEKGELKRQAIVKVFEKNKKTIQIDKDNVERVIKENIDIPLDGTKENCLRKFICLLLICGSRPIELVRDANYSIDPNHPGYIKQVGIAKRREYKIKENLDNEVVKPLLFISPQRFIKEVADMRKELYTHYKTFNDNMGPANKVFAKYFKNELFEEKDRNDKRIRMYSCRAIYANVSYILFGKNKKTKFGENPTLTLWVSGVLAHDPYNLTTSLNYTWINLEDDCEDQIEQRQEETDEFVIGMTKLFYENKKLGLRVSQRKYEDLFKSVAPRKKVRDLFKKLNGV